MTLAEIDAEIAALEAARSARLRGEARLRVQYEGAMVEKALPTLAEITGEIARLKVARSKITGEPSGYGPIGVGFGCRP